jgi:predicted transcriptional regulator
MIVKLTAGAEDPDLAYATAFIEQPKEFARLQRHINQIEKTYFKATKELNELQAARKNAKAEEQHNDAQGEVMSLEEMEAAMLNRIAYLEQKLGPDTHTSADGFVLSNQKMNVKERRQADEVAAQRAGNTELFVHCATK